MVIIKIKQKVIKLQNIYPDTRDSVNKARHAFENTDKVNEFMARIIQGKGKARRQRKILEEEEKMKNSVKEGIHCKCI